MSQASISKRVVDSVPPTLGNIPVLNSPGRAVFQEYVDSATPVIIQNGRNSEPIANVLTEQDAIDTFGDLLIQVQRNYTSPLSRVKSGNRIQNGLSQKVRNDIFEMPLAEYFAHIRKTPDTDLLCVEYHTPKPVADMIGVPEYCRSSGSGEPLVSFMFVANKGNYAHLHFDGDFRNVLLYQVFGRKRVVMVPLSATEKISPAMNFSKVLIQNMAPEEKLDFFRYLGAYDAIINPGDMVYFPPSIWHYIEYVDNGMSLNFRFGRDEIAQKLVDANRVPFYPELHQLIDEIRVHQPAERSRIAGVIWNEIDPVLRSKYESSIERHRAVQDLYRRLLQEHSGFNSLPRQVTIDCPIAEVMAVERYDSPSQRWRDELQLGVAI
ncbi:hypothetical protein HCA61_14990 [Rhodococcus sp. HNM0563]|uniref:cupin-like domain-containing protein n=1 Tax=Rhodococcus sp. HNM0563 TaxID=2716339 RepID=UPI00146D2A7B|nr:hypothetical protein [Rhodococcus sp. HNM0563]